MPSWAAVGGGGPSLEQEEQGLPPARAWGPRPLPHREEEGWFPASVSLVPQTVVPCQAVCGHLATVLGRRARLCTGDHTQLTPRLLVTDRSRGRCGGKGSSRDSQLQLLSGVIMNSHPTPLGPVPCLCDGKDDPKLATGPEEVRGTCPHPEGALAVLG